ncbi:hypothetical protein BS78_07G134800 [Paspalum vaginatum]|nr:hypothetical protein BS78_07G134800 [Paspalum vaginatum]
MSPAAAARPQRGPLPKRKEVAAAGALAVLSRAAVDVVLYSFMAALWADSAVGTVVRILGRWVCGEGSSVEAAGFAIGAWCKFIMVLLFPSYLPLVIRRVAENALFYLKEQEKDEREKLPKTNRAVSRPRLPKGVKVAPLFAFLPIWTLQILALTVQYHHEEECLVWKVSGVVIDITCLCTAAILAVWGVPNEVILMMVCKAKHRDDDMQ